MAKIPFTPFTLEQICQHDTNNPKVDTAYSMTPSSLYALDWSKTFRNSGDEPATLAIQKILNNGIPVSSYDVDGKAALHLAAKHKNLTVAKLLIERGADVNATRRWPSLVAFENRPAKPSWLWTPLHYAAKRDDGDMIQLLIDAGANIEMKSSIRETALNVAYRERTVTALWLLHQHGATSNETPYTPGIDGPLPPWLNNRMQQGSEPSFIITRLEKDILQTITQSIGKLQVHGERYCDRCRASFSFDSTMKNPSNHVFGYIKRCEVCASSLSTAPSVLVPSRNLLETTPSIFKTKSPDGTKPTSFSLFVTTQLTPRPEDLEYLLAAADRTLDKSTGSDTAFMFAKYWLLRCLKSHISCRGLSEKPPELPTRVIDVSFGDSTPRPVLYESKAGERGYYCALSYRWVPFTVKSNKKSLPHFRKLLNWIILPTVIQDAIKITMKLGIQYLWVDAYCIVQDDKEEWTRESKMMHEIYRNALLTIGVVGSSSSRKEGIFQPRNGQEIRKTPRRRPHGILDTRGWTMQEQYLSPRVLSYADGQLFWDCLHFSASESCPAGVPACVDEDHRDEDLRASRALLINSNYEFDSRDRMHWLWRKFLCEYTQRELTQEADRLAAIRGISSSFSKRLDDVLVAGIWKKTLIRHLAWWVKPEMLSPNWRDNCVSWSWLSVGDAVTYECILGHQTNAAAERFQIDPLVNQAKLLDASGIDEIWQSAYSTGFLLLHGHLSKVFSFKAKTGLYLIPQRYMAKLESKLRKELVAEEALYKAVVGWISLQHPPPHTRGCEIWYPDRETVFSQGEELFVFVLGTSSTGHEYSLVLRASDASASVFFRVGLCAWNPGNVTYLQGLYFLGSRKTIRLY